MVHADKFIQWVIVHNKNSLQFVHSESNILAYAKLVPEHHMSPDFYGFLDIIEPYFTSMKRTSVITKRNRKEKHKHNKTVHSIQENQQKFENNTLRMSLHEMN